MARNIVVHAIGTLSQIAWLLASSALCNEASAASGDPDPEFGTAGIAHLGLVDAGAQRNTHPVVQPDGKIVLCGTRGDDGATASDFFVARLSASGALDTSFSFDGKVAIDFDGGAVAHGDTCSALALQSDGKIVVAGVRDKAGNDDFAVMRLASNGALDNTFGSKGKVGIAFDLGGSNVDFANALAIDDDGNIVVAGYALGASSTMVAVARLNPLGLPDANFNANGRETIAFTPAGAGSPLAIEATSMRIQHDGRIVLAGTCETSGSAQSNLDFAVVRIFPDGSVDAAFGSAGIAHVDFGPIAQGGDIAYDVIEQGDGKLLLAGAAGNGMPIAAIARLNADGGVDETFGLHGKHVYALGTPIGAFLGLAPQGQQVVALGFEGDSNGSDYAVVRLQHDDEVFADGFENSQPSM